LNVVAEYHEKIAYMVRYPRLLRNDDETMWLCSLLISRSDQPCDLVS
jgi:hypothetical protein